MKPILIIFVAMFFMGCASVPTVTIDAKTCAFVKLNTEKGTTDITVCFEIKKDAETGVSYNTDAEGFYKDADGSVYKCKVSVGSNDKPAKDVLDIKEDCQIDILK